jgi:hypothetical protein
MDSGALPVIYYSGGIPLTWPPQPTDGASLWSAGLNVRTELVSVDAAFLALDPTFVTERVLRAFTGCVEEELVAGYIRAATEIAEYKMQVSIRPQRLALVTNGVPALGVYELPGGPVRDVISYDYYDAANALQTLGGSPAPWLFVQGQPGTLQALHGASWPTVVGRPDAVRIVYDTGYAASADIPWKLRIGLGALVGELYKNPDLSNDQGQIANLINLDHFFPRQW